jgi:murein L,D-transpeptidase YcbB/YkuD
MKRVQGGKRPGFPRRLGPMGVLAAWIGAWAILLAGAPASAAPAACPPVALGEGERRLIFEALQRGDEPTEAPPASVDDATMNAALLRYATVQLGLRLQPASIDRLWAIAPASRDLAGDLAAARRDDRLAAWLASLEPPHRAYRDLLAERCRYIAIVDAGGWPALPPGPAVKAGDTHPLVEALRQRLRIEGYDLAASEAPQRFDAALGQALRAFQGRHDLEADGVLGPATRRALDVTAEKRLVQIEANLERWRWLPHALPADRLEVDVGAANVTLFQADQPVLRMRAVVGDPDHKTPMFVSRVESVVFNPPWNVPSSIAQAEILPRLGRDPGYLARNGFVRTPQGLQQRPGPGNALGRLKFDLPSPFGVYLHDTPGRAAFAGRVRTLSHGCMRLEQPRELAERLLGPQGWGRSQIDQAIARGETRRVVLQTPVPLFVVYRTAEVDAEGRVVFRPDPYGWDAKLAAALARAPVQASPPAGETECAVSAQQASKLE